MPGKEESVLIATLCDYVHKCQGFLASACVAGYCLIASPAIRLIGSCSLTCLYDVKGKEG